MITKIARFIFILSLALGVLGVSTSAALAAKPDQGEVTFTQSTVVSDICSFTFTVDSTYDMTWKDFYDQSGAWTRSNYHFDAQDTFTSENGKTLVGLPYTFNWIITTTRSELHGINEKIRLPDGSLFISAGWTDYLLNHNGQSFILSSDKGNPGDVTAFCAALE